MSERPIHHLWTTRILKYDSSTATFERDEMRLVFPEASFILATSHVASVDELIGVCAYIQLSSVRLVIATEESIIEDILPKS